MTRILDGETPVPLPMAPPAGGLGRFVDPGGLLADGQGEGFEPTGDPATDAALAAAFGPPPGEGDTSEQAILDALGAILQTP